MAGAKIAFLVAACLVAGLVLGDAAPMKCKAKGTVKGKSGKSTLMSTLCWDGVISPSTIISVTWKITNVDNYYSGILGNSTDLMAGVKFAAVWPPIKTLRTMDGADTADSMVGPGMYPNKAAMLKLICSGKAEIGVLTQAPGDSAPKVAFKQAVVVAQSTTDDCQTLNTYLG